MQAGIKVGDPERQQQENKSDDDAYGKTAAGPAKFFIGHERFEIHQPE